MRAHSDGEIVKHDRGTVQCLVRQDIAKMNECEVVRLFRREIGWNIKKGREDGKEVLCQRMNKLAV
jgi:hypothetical protein